MNITESTESRKLAAVMFTDIEGYTTMFHQDESNALNQIDLHRKDIENITSKHFGQIIQFYGDGSLVIFDSVVDAVKSAIEIQAVSTTQNLPVRIGIHLGDLIIKEGNVFGDVVNLTSRLQTIGVPGSIIVTRKIIDEVSNHPEITSERLGHYELKNVTEPLEVYAITGPGLNVPAKPIDQKKRSTWLIPFVFLLLALGGWYVFDQKAKNNLEESVRDEKIAVPPFENFTAEASFNPVAQMAAHWITTELIELAEANVVSYPSSSFYTNTAEASMPLEPHFGKQTGAVNIIRGAFSLTGQKKDSLVFWATIINSRTREPLPIEFDKAYCGADDPLTCIKQMSNQIKGFWRSKSDKVLSPPNYNAYKEYLLARNTWDGINDSIPEAHLREAIRLDPNFLDAYFLLLDMFYNQRLPEEASDTLLSMRNKFTDLTPRQENYLRYHEEDVKGRRVEAFKLFMNEYAIDPKDIFVNTSGMVMAQTYLNDPDRVIAFHEEINIDSMDLNTCPYCLERVMLVMQAYIAKGEIQKATAMAEKLKLHAIKRDDYHRLVEWYMFVGDTSSIENLLKRLSTTKLDRDYRYLAFVAGRQAALQGKIDLRNYYADRAITLYNGETSRALARAYMLKEDFERAKSVFREVLKKDSTDVRVYGDLGVVYARLGDRINAEAMITKLEEMKQPFDYGETTYMQGKIKAALNEKDEALRLLSRSIDEGMQFFNSVSFDGDPDLSNLHEHEEYKKIINRNRQLAN